MTEQTLSPKEAFLKSAAKPRMPRPRLEDVPSSLASARAWCGWRWKWKEPDKKWIKKPFNARSLREGPLKEEGWNLPENLLSLPDLMRLIEASPLGLGFGVGLASPKGMTEAGGPASLDFDNVCHPDGTFINKKLQAIVEATQGRILWETSASGTGLHAIGMGLTKIPPMGSRKYAIEGGGEIEYLVEGRFAAISGAWIKTLGSTPPGSLDEIAHAFPKPWQESKAPRLVVNASPPLGSQEEEFRAYLRKRASGYVQAMDPSIDGQSGHAQLMRVAAVLKHGFQYGGEYSAWESDGLEILHDFNRRGDPETEAQLRHKWESANTTGENLAFKARADWEAKWGGSFSSKQAAPSAPSGSPPPAKEEWTVLEEESLLPAETIGELPKEEFLWEGFIPRGYLGILSGWPGAGKSTALGGIVAAATRAGDFIGPSGSLPGMDPGREPMAALWISCEEREERIRARVQECGADLSRVYIVRTIKEAKGERRRKRAFQLPTDMERLHFWLSQIRPGIVILDSMSGLFSADYDSTKSQKSREILNELANLAEEFGTTIILISHHTKQSAGKEANKNGPLYLAAEGSIAFAASARFQLLVAQHPEDKDLPKRDRRKVLFVAKTNEFEPFMGCPFRLSSIDLPSGGSVRIPRWEAASFMDEEDFRNSSSTQREKSGPAPEKMARAMEALVSFFESHGGSVESLAVQERRKELEAELGVSYGTIRDGFNRLKADGILRSDPHSSRWLFTPKPKGSQESPPLAPQSRG